MSYIYVTSGIITFVNSWPILVFVALPLAVYLIILIYTLRDVSVVPLTPEAEEKARAAQAEALRRDASPSREGEKPPQKTPREKTKPEVPYVPYPADSPKYMFDYRGRLWVEKRRKDFFRRLRRPNLPPEKPQ